VYSNGDSNVGSKVHSKVIRRSRCMFVNAGNSEVDRAAANCACRSKALRSLLFRRLACSTLPALLAITAFAGDSPKPAKLSEQSRRDLIRVFTAEDAFARRVFPRGKVGLKIENGQVSPSDSEVRQLAADNGPACSLGERVQITSVRFTRRAIIFEINGGPLAKKKWWQRVEVGSAGGVEPAVPSGSKPEDVYNQARGSYVTLAFKDFVPELTAGQVKQMLAPVLDFKAQSAAEAYERSLPPKLQQAIQEHRALVGMDREMVTYAKGRPPRRIREGDGATEYEEWIYGQPPAEVEFIRFVGDKVIRIETMKVDGEKTVRTQSEVDLADEVSAMAGSEPTTPVNGAPSLLRPGESTPQLSRESPDARPAPATSPVVVGAPTAVPEGSPPLGGMPPAAGTDTSTGWPPR